MKRHLTETLQHHWDLVCIQTGIWWRRNLFDDVLIRKDGRFVVPELECLNQKI